MKPTVIDPKTTTRAEAYALWMNAPNPMVTFFKTLDVTPLVRFSRKRGLKFNMLLCWCIGKAAAEMEDFYLLPVGDKLMQYDRLAINTVVATRDGSIATCDIPVSADLEQFNQDYLKLTGQVREIGESYERLDRWSMYLITAYDKAENDIGRKADKNRKIYNGMMKTYYYQFLGPRPPKKGSMK